MTLDTLMTFESPCFQLKSGYIKVQQLKLLSMLSFSLIVFQLIRTLLYLMFLKIIFFEFKNR